MSKKEKKDQAKEPTTKYEVEQKDEVDSDELHPVLVALLDRSKENHAAGNVFSHDKAMEMYNQKISAKK